MQALLPSRPCRPSTPRSLPALAAILAGALSLASFACEPRVEEPLPPARSETDKQGASTQMSPLGSAKKRCIKATPEKPTRAMPKSPDPACPPDDLASPPKLRTGKVVFVDAGAKEITVEIAETEATRARGLMFRREMAQDHGMIFLFKERENHSFWMHNTCIPLDMLFLDDDGTIVGIQENTTTMDDSTFEVGCPSRNVLEVNAGFTRKHGIKAGQRVELRGI
jgi:uncharacterized membrane protein (UPF0127 family)